MPLATLQALNKPLPGVLSLMASGSPLSYILLIKSPLPGVLSLVALIPRFMWLLCAGLDLVRAPYCYVLYGVKYIDPVSLAPLFRHVRGSAYAAFAPNISSFRTTFLFIWGSIASHACSSYKYRNILEVLPTLITNTPPFETI